MFSYFCKLLIMATHFSPIISPKVKRLHSIFWVWKDKKHTRNALNVWKILQLHGQFQGGMPAPWAKCTCAKLSIWHLSVMVHPVLTNHSTRWGILPRMRFRDIERLDQGCTARKRQGSESCILSHRALRHLLVVNLDTKKSPSSPDTEGNWSWKEVGVSFCK